MNTSPKKFPTLRVFLGTITALAGAITAVATIPDIGCKVGWNSAACIVPKREFELITRTETGESLAGVKILLTGKGAPEEGRTDDRGYAKVQIASKGDVQVNLTKPGYPAQNFTLNLENDQSTVRFVQFDKSGQPIVTASTSTPAPNSLSSPIVPPLNNKPSAPVPPTSNNPSQTAVDSNVTWELKSCLRKQKNVSCIFSISTSEDRGYGISLNNKTSIVDASGNEYYSSKIQIGTRNAGSGGTLGLDLVKGSHYPTTIEFTGVPTSVSQVTLLEIQIIYGELIKFRDVPINADS